MLLQIVTMRDVSGSSDLVEREPKFSTDATPVTDLPEGHDSRTASS